MSDNNKIHPAVLMRTIHIVDAERHGHEADYILDGNQPDSHEYRWKEEWDMNKAFYMQAWNAAGRAEELIYKQCLRKLKDKGISEPTAKQLEAEDKSRCEIEHRSPMKKELLQICQDLQTSEDLVLMGSKDKEDHLQRLWFHWKRCNYLLNNKRQRIHSGHSWKSVAALFNNILSMLENMGIKVDARRYKRDQYTEGKPIVDFTWNDDAQQTKDGLDWADEVRAETYNQYDTGRQIKAKLFS